MRYWPSIKRYSWTILVCTVLAAIASFLIAKAIPASFQVSSTVLVQVGAPGTSITSLTSSSDPTISLTEANTYAAQIPTRSVMEYVFGKYPEIKAHGFTADDLLANITATASTTAATISISAIAQKPDEAVMLANDVSNGFASYTQNLAQQRLEVLRSALQAQLTALTSQRVALEKQIEAITSADPRYVVYNNQLTQLNSEFGVVNGQLLPLPTTVRSDVFVVQQAKLVDAASSSKTTTILLATVGVGIVLGILIMLLLVFLDNRLSDANQVKEKLGLAHLGGLASDSNLKSFPLQITGSTLQQITDIGANLHLTNVLAGRWHAPEGVVLLVTSSQTTEGKTSVAAALATALARVGTNVVVIDGNLRMPATHLALGVNPSGMGLSGLLKSVGSVDDAVIRSNIPGLWLLPAGAPIEEPALMLEQKLPTILTQMRKKADVTIIDGPSVLNSADAVLMATLADGVALVIDARRDKMPLLLRTKEILSTLSNTSVGVILNRLPRKRKNNYFGAGYGLSNAAVMSESARQYANGQNGSNGQMPEVPSSPLSPIPATPMGQQSLTGLLSGMQRQSSVSWANQAEQQTPANGQGRMGSAAANWQNMARRDITPPKQ